MNQVRDIFIFCCYTGLAYADVEKLTHEEITTGIDGEMDLDKQTKDWYRPEFRYYLKHWKFLTATKMILNAPSKGRLLPVLSKSKMK